MADVFGISEIPGELNPPADLYIGGAVKDVRNGIDYSISNVEDVKKTLIDAIASMNSLIRNFDPKVLSKQLEDIDVRKIKPDKAIMPVVILDNSLPTLPVRPNFQELGVINFDINLPVPPEKYKGTYLEWVGTAYDSEVERNLLSYLVGQLAAQQFGMPETVVDAMRSRAYRQIDTDIAAQKRAAYFRYPLGGQSIFAAQGLEIEFERIRQKDRLSVNDKIIEEQFKAYLQDKQIVLQVSVDIDRLMSERWNWWEQRDLDSKSKAIELAVSMSSNAINQYVAEIEAEIKRWTLEAERIDALSKLNASKASIYETDGRVFGAITEAKSSLNASKVRHAEAVANINQSNAQSASIENDIELRIADLILKKDTAELDAELKMSDINLSADKYYGDLAADVLKSQVQVLSQLTASLLGIINFGASESFSSSASLSQSHGISIGFSESTSSDLTGV